ncbi:MAG: hypothetical protein M3314_07895, partial [Actinomycetota bacterium]|nr:hypothetical protein [Actinomycetota bacterium]
MPKRGWPDAVVLFSAAILAIGPLGGVAAAGQPDEADVVRVFTENVNWYAGANLVNPDARTDPNVSLFNHSGLALEVPPDDPITWGEWSEATATSRVSTIGGPDGPRTDVRISMQGLVPNGVYSIFWFTLAPDSENALCPGIERLLPLDAFKPDALAPDPSSFFSDANGAAAFHGRVGGDLLAATSLYFVVIYHHEG